MNILLLTRMTEYSTDIILFNEYFSKAFRLLSQAGATSLLRHQLQATLSPSQHLGSLS